MKKYFLLFLVSSTFMHGSEENNISLPLNLGIAVCYTNKEAVKEWNEYQQRCEELLKRDEYQELIISQLNRQNHIAGLYAVAAKVLTVIALRRQKQQDKTMLSLYVVEREILRLTVETALFKDCKPLFTYNLHNVGAIRNILALSRPVNAQSRE